MTKIKTKRSAAKRFSFTGSGKIKRNAAYHRHYMTHKPQSRKQQDRGSHIVAPGDAKLIKRMLPNGG
jgi:large subunit ribosomal protein L35